MPGLFRPSAGRRCSTSGAVAPIIIAIILAIWLPELVRFLLARGIRQDAVRSTIERIMPGEIPAGVELVAPPDPAREGVPVKHLFMEGRAIPTVLLWVPFFMVFMILVTVTFWDSGGVEFRRLLAVGGGADRRPQ